MKKSIFLKIFAGYAIIITVLMSLILFLSLRTIRAHHIETQRMSLGFLAAGLEAAFLPLLEQSHREKLDALAKELGKDTNSRITIIDPAGVVLADSWKDPSEMEIHRIRPEIMMALQGETGTALRFSPTIQEDLLYVAIPLATDGKIGGVLRVSLPVRSIEESLAGLRNSMIMIAAVLAALSLLVAFVVSRNLSRPIRQLSLASQKVASGDFTARVLLGGRDEIRELADNFNYMTDRMKALFAELSETGEELRGIVSAIHDGLLVLDSDGRISLSNESFEQIVGDSAVEGKFYWEVMQVPELDDLVRTAKREKADLVREILFNDRVYLFSGSILTLREGLVILIHDITDIRSVEKVKKDFVVNLSHELRTPLTAIKGFLETMQEEVTVEGQHYLGIVRRHTDRLADIVEDLLVLSELEDSGTGLDLERVTLKELLEDVLHIFEPRVREKGLELTLEASGGGPVVRVDRFKLEQVFINLIANAVKYTDRGSIRIRISKTDDSAVTVIEDTGVGIPEEHLPRIFERFYVVDKSRSKALGGTGLGLSIVKHIILLHNRAIDVDSEPGKGTRFTVTLPL